MPYYPEKVLFNFSNHELNDDKKPLLCKGLNFPIPPKRFHYADHMLPFQLLNKTLQKMKFTLKDFLSNCE